MIEEDLDAALERQALEERTSKAALIRRYVRQSIAPLPPLEEDPLWQMVGADGDTAPVDDIDEFLYGPIEHV